MFSKKLMLSFLLAFNVIFSVGCDRFLRGPEAVKNETVIVGVQELQCLKSLSPRFTAMVQDQLTNEEIQENFDCLVKSFNKFAEFTRGAEKDSYRDTELQYFFNRYLLKEHQITEDFLKQLMKLKLILVGGFENSLTRHEVNEIIHWIGFFSTQAKILNGHFLTLGFKAKDEKAQYGAIYEASKKLKNIVKQFVMSSRIHMASPEMQDFENLFMHISGFSSSEGFVSIQKWLPFVDAIKKTFFGDRSVLQSSKDWVEASEWMSDAYGAALLYYYRIRGLQYETVEEWAIVLAWIDHMFSLVDKSPALQRYGLLKKENLDNLIDVAWNLKINPVKVPANVFKEAYKKFIHHFLEEKKNEGDDYYLVSGLNRSHWNIIKFEYKLWKLIQLSIHDRYIGVLNATVIRDNFFSRIQDLEEGASYKDNLKTAFAGWNSLITGENRVRIANDGKMRIRYFPTNKDETLLGQSTLNLLHVWTRFIMRGYGTPSRTLFESQVSERRFVHLEEDFRDFGKGLGFLDPRSEGGAARSFKEGNYFTFSGNGDGFLSAKETFELFAFLMAGGSSAVTPIMKDLTIMGCQSSEVDVFGKPMFHESCLHKLFITDFKKYFSNLMWMVEDFQNLSLEEKEKIYSILRELAVTPKKDNRLIEYAEIRTFAVLIHYVESVMIQFDTNKDQVLTESELRKAAPRFSFFIRQLGNVDEDRARQVFLYLMYKRRPPRTASKSDLLVDLGAFASNITHIKLGPFEYGGLDRNYGPVTRSHLFEIISALKKADH